MENLNEDVLYLNFLPSELIEEILLYSDVESIKKLSELIETSNMVNKIIVNRTFWVDKLTIDGVEIYLELLDYYKNYLLTYYDILLYLNYINKFLTYIHNKYPIMIATNSKMNLKKFIHLNLLNFKKESNHGNFIIYIKYENGGFKNLSSPLKYEVISNDEIKLLLIKLILIDVDISGLI